MRTEFTWKALLSATYWTNSTFGGGCPAGNDITYILSVAATILLSLGFLTGLMGINVGGIPGADDETGFLVFVAICSALVITPVVIFRKLRWL